MFVIERLVRDRQDKIDAWEKKRKKIVDEADYNSEVRDWEERNPKPYSIVKFARALGISFLVLVLAFTLSMYIREAIVSYNSPQSRAARVEKAKQKASAEAEAAKHQSHNNCRKFNKNDHIRIQYGDYASLFGVVVGGCNDNESYQIKLDKDQKADLPDGNNEKVDVGSKTIAVGSDDNLVKVEENK